MNILYINPSPKLTPYPLILIPDFEELYSHPNPGIVQIEEKMGGIFEELFLQEEVGWWSGAGLWCWVLKEFLVITIVQG